MRHVFKATKMGWGKKKRAYTLMQSIIPKKKLWRNSSHSKGPRKKDTHIQVMNMTDKNITMLLMLASLKITTCRTLISS